MKKCVRLSIGILIIWLNSRQVEAKAPGVTHISGKISGTITAPSQPAVPPVPEVVSVVAKKIDTIDTRHNGARKSAMAGDLIMVALIHPKEFLDTRPADLSKLILYAEGIELKGISSDLFNGVSKPLTQAEDTVWIPFKLVRDTTTKAAWDCLYRIASWDKINLRVHVRVGWQGMFPVRVSRENYENTGIKIVFYERWAFIVWLALYIIIVATFVVLAIKSNMLRECDDGPYSLAQSQLAFWTILIIGSFIYTLVLTDIAYSLNNSILLLLGVSLTTNGTALYIDYYKKKNKATLKPKVSKGFLTDILGDGNTIVVQRVQNAAWTLVLGLYLIYYTISNKTLPVYPDALLFLTGISSFAYVAAKPTENKKAGAE